MQGLKSLYNFVSSMKVGLILLALVGIASAIGASLLPNHFFHTTPFLVLLLLLFINMGFCTFNQLSKFGRSLKPGKLLKRLWSRQFSLLILHMGIVLILIGATINIYQGQSAQVRLVTGDAVHIGDIISSSEDFLIRVNKFHIDYYEDGSPSQYYSDIDIVKYGKPVENHLVSVNNPLNYHGIKAYQHSYGHLINMHTQDAEEKTALTVGEGQGIEFKNTPRSVKIFKYIPNYDARYGMNTKTIRPDNPKVIYSVYEQEHLLGIGAADLGEEVMIDEGVFITFDEIWPYTVLTIKHDPGLPLTASGGILLMLGVCLVYFFAKDKKTKTNGGVI